METISQDKINREAWKFYICIPLWILYFITIPYAYTASKFFFFTYAFFIGNFLFCWMGYLFHETWHEYVPVIPNKMLYYIYGLLLFSDPQIYRITHGSHHAKAHTYEDLEFYPIGEVHNKILKLIYRWLEFFIGTAFLFALHSMTLPVNPHLKNKFSIKKSIIASVLLIVTYSTIISLSLTLFPVKLSTAATAYLLTIWIHSFFLHQSQMVEHGFLIVDGSTSERNIATRNISPEGFLNKFFLLMTHNDPREHVFHHTHPQKYLRPFPESTSMPEGSSIITLKKYFELMLRGLKGEDLKE